MMSERTMALESTHLRVFSTVAQYGSITRAAEALHTVQSNVTMHIKALEAELGVSLLHRNRRGVTLTRGGERLLPYAIKTQGLLLEARNAVANADQPPEGTLRLGTLETTAAIRMPQLVAQYGALFPKVDLSLITGTTLALSQDVLAHKLEGAFVAGPTLRPEFVEETIFVEELVLVSAPGVRSLRDLCSLGDVKILVFREGCSYRTKLERILQSRGARSIRVMEFGTLDGILGCAGAGLGVTMLPKALVHEASRRGEIAVHRLPHADSRVETVFIRRHDGFVSSALASFISFVKRFKAGKKNGA
jgi:LysR family transcriptional regulator, cell division regulator